MSRIEDLLPHDWKAWGRFRWVNCYTSLIGDNGDTDDEPPKKTSVFRIMVHVFDDLIERQRFLVGTGEHGEWYPYNWNFIEKHLRNIFRLNRRTEKN